MKYEYLIFNFFILAGPLFVFFLNKKWIIRPDFKPLIISILVTSVIFITLDQLAVNYFWFFNAKYITGLFLLYLPIEEIMFFVTVPFACLMLWVNYKDLFIERKIINLRRYLVVFLSILILLLFSYNKLYSSSVVFSFLVVLVLDFLLQTNLFVKKSFVLFIFLITNFLTFIFNLYLTARPVVLYNAIFKTNINIASIPIEDFVFGMSLISLVIILYEKNILLKSDAKE